MAKARGAYRAVSATGQEFAHIEDGVSMDITKQLYEQDGYLPPFDQLPTEAEYESRKKKGRGSSPNLTAQSAKRT